VDYPATQAAKRARLADAGITIPDSVRFVGVDFTTTTLRDALTAARFDQSAPAFCSCATRATPAGRRSQT